ncbi:MULTISPECIES: type III-A CRISPR-associated protein Cas10/Csm1 [Thermodesulfobacterium]|jgi:CRISPR-associated protein Csm1|uniref:CRISPR system single-strand-specific deoxyribonuclease Cas10/Csm1 (subtype III-A) n=1 Tax=Thermodesulfobacterium commune TaxID=1741 RepID=A0A3B8N3C4_9BACT|nr:type III-A CRISPR-associated protein Cas10/Csm1 [Thermodesulfobacterium sp.]HAA83653.1 type III-A CRISPR-associated protein Cas10/Csm1 [Thermodesulfobacterium commune]MBZ4682396.1 cas10 [Thermodesulfobacterium sp.]MDK2861548.1 CRISPR-associated protein Csm1 [Thermodesulfobacterium sp.]MDN5380419.1 CRISPR-associated protein Csm1 [Thermodesulfobacterium sp.]HBT03753.1 type III-A CRISPR-associated protein Cas10/Csm1 [Thermodesulfobacterium commune]
MGKDPLLYRVVLASLLHDIGKIYQRAKIFLDSDVKNQENQELYQPFYKGRYTHEHVLYTHYFIEKFKNLIPSYFLKYSSEKDSLINLACKHHKPDSEEQLIITEADTLSSGYERRKYDEDIPSKIPAESRPLLCLFEDLSLNENWVENKEENFKYAYDLATLNPEVIFPKAKDKISINSDSYKKIINEFEDSLNKLSEITRKLGLNEEQWLEGLNNLLMHYLVFVPSATVTQTEDHKFVEIPSDVSLYDHLYLTASLASALYLYHKETNSLNENSIKNRSIEKFLFIEGNFYGIQNFIFSSGGSTRKYAAKLLRGRSFYVSLLSELSALRILERLGLSFCSVLFNNGGKFLILAPNLPDTSHTLKEVEEEINTWLYEHFYGEVSIGIIWTAAKPEDLLHPEGYVSLIRNLGKLSEAKKYQKFDLLKFGGVYEDYFLEFSGSKTCDLCGKRPFKFKIEETDVETCGICYDQITIGQSIVKRNFIAIFNNKPASTLNTLKVPIFNNYFVGFLKSSDLGKIDSKNLLHLWNISLPQVDKEDSTQKALYTIIPKKFINSYVPKDENNLPITLEELAKKAVNQKDDELLGISALGVLKSDVDNLGLLFNKGLRPEKRTLSRYIAISRQLNLFFAYYLPWICLTKSSYKEIYNVFAGGDDLFIIGPWNTVLNFSEEVVKEFRRYTAYNTENLTISSGFVLTKPEIPVIELAERSEKSLKHTKNSGKNGITVFNCYVKWDQFFELNAKIFEKLSNWYFNEYFQRSYLYKLNFLIEMYSIAQRFLQDLKNTDLKNLTALTWPSKLYYFTVRNINKTKFENKEKYQEFLKEFLIDLKQTFDHYGEGFRIPLWKLIYETRRAGHE